MSELIDVVLPADQVEGTRSQVQRWLKAVGEPVSAPRAAGRDRNRQGDGRSPVAGRRRARRDRRGRRHRRRAGRGARRACAPAAAAAMPAARAGTVRIRRGAAGRDARAAARRRRRDEPGRAPPARGARPHAPSRSRAAARAGASRSRTCWRQRRDAAASATLARAAPAPEPAEAGCARDAAHADAPAHRRAHGREPAAHRAARDDRVPGRHDGRARAIARQRKADFERRGLSLTLTAYFVAACVEAIARRAGSERPLERRRDPAQRSHRHRHRHGARGTAGWSCR